MKQPRKEIIKYIPSIYFSLFANRNFRLGLYKDNNNNYVWLPKAEAFDISLTTGEKIPYERVTCDTSQDALELAKEGARQRNGGAASVAYSLYVHQEVSYATP